MNDVSRQLQRRGCTLRHANGSDIGVEQYCLKWFSSLFCCCFEHIDLRCLVHTPCPAHAITIWAVFSCSIALLPTVTRPFHSRSSAAACRTLFSPSRWKWPCLSVPIPTRSCPHWSRCMCCTSALNSCTCCSGRRLSACLSFECLPISVCFMCAIDNKEMMLEQRPRPALAQMPFVSLLQPRADGVNLRGARATHAVRVKIIGKEKVEVVGALRHDGDLDGGGEVGGGKHAG